MTVKTIDSDRYIEEVRELTGRLLDEYLPLVNSEPTSLHEAMRYSVMAGGKRLRSILAFAAYEYCGGNTGSAAASTIHPAMAGLEMVHTYSLIHDDLPCMDDDDLRRGMPTCHKKFGEAIAVLAGDALHVLAFQLMARTGYLQTVTELAGAIDTSGMIGGQIADMEAEGKPAGKTAVLNIHRRKTGALIRSSVRIGAILADADKGTLNKLTEYGEHIGLAFQIIDDILDIEGNEKLTGKAVGSDSRKHKATYPAAVGLESARTEAGGLIDQALGLFNNYDENMLASLARYIGLRES